MDLSKALEGIEKLFLEILGYLLPGLTLYYLGANLIDQPIKQSLVVLSQTNEWGIVAIAYALGYVVYGLALAKDEFVEHVLLKSINKVKGKNRKNEIKSRRTLLNERIQQSPEVEITKSILNKLLAGSIPNIVDGIEHMDLSSLRNLAMSYVPQSDRKVYTFMFRADLSDHIGTLAFVFGLWGLLGEYTSRHFCQGLMLVAQDSSIYWYAGLLLTSYLLAKTKARFLKIALRIPFSMFIAIYYSGKPARKETNNE